MAEQVSTRKDQIYSTAASLFSRQGYHATTMREIARALEIEGGSLYSHINGKQELLYGIVLRASEQFRWAAREAVEAGSTPVEQLRELMRRHLAIVAESTPRAGVYFHEWRHLSAEQQATIKHHRDEYEHSVRAIIRAGMESGEFIAVDERLAGLEVLSLLNWSYQWYRPGGEWSADELADRFFDLVMCGLRPRADVQGDGV